jgi:hypothetical protein
MECRGKATQRSEFPVAHSSGFLNGKVSEKLRELSGHMGIAAKPKFRS